MNQDTEKNINEAIDWLQQTGGQIQDFAVEQAPLYCREVVAWELWSGLVLVALGLGLLLVAVWLMKKGIAIYRGGGCGEEIGPMILSIFAFIVGGFLLANGAGSSIKASVAPRLVIVEHLRGLNK